MFDMRPVAQLTLGALLLWPAIGSTYELDTHYYLRFSLALSTCFDWDEAHLIASGDIGMDENSTVSAEMNPIQRRNKVDWHAFGHSDKRYRELWLRSTQEPDLERRLIKFGQFMHFAEDWEAHAGYGLRMGHARDTYAGQDPDSLANSEAKNHRMVQASLDHLLKTCADLDRLNGADPDALLITAMLRIYATGLLDDLYDASDPSWKKGKTDCRRKCVDIRAANKLRIERVVLDRLLDNPFKNVPADFAPGEATGIPPPLGIPFDPSGAIVTSVSILDSMDSWASASETSADIVLELSDAEINYRSTRSIAAGWNVTIVATNEGEAASPSGQIEIVVIDSDDESVLAQHSEPLAPLDPAETRDYRISLATSSRPPPDAMIAAFARVGGELSAGNSEDWLMLGDAEYDDAEFPDVPDLDPPAEGEETIVFVREPRTLIVDNNACVLIEAVTSAGDSTEKLEPPELEIVGGTIGAYAFRPTFPGRWSAFSTEDAWVAGKIFGCFQPTEATYQALGEQDPAALALAVTLAADGAEPQTAEFPMAPEFIAGILEIGYPDSPQED
jgi:hypothetical protein